MNECMPHYYRITNGHGLGAELVMAAEASFMQGRLHEAEIGLECARTKSQAAGRKTWRSAAIFFSSGCGSRRERAASDMESRKQSLQARHDVVLLNMLDAIYAYYYALIQDTARIPEVFPAAPARYGQLLCPGRP